ncbi:hypothetical protein GQ457_01G016870 [Hibiscus cannabinus]
MKSLTRFMGHERTFKKRKDDVLPCSKMVNADLDRIMNFDEVQLVMKMFMKDQKNTFEKIECYTEVEPIRKD